MTINDSAPTATGVIITGTPNVGQLLTGQYTYSDVDGDLEGDSTYRWLRDGVAIGGTSSTTYTVVASDTDHSITFEVTPVAATGALLGGPVQSGGVTILNSAPTATSVSIAGTPNIEEIAYFTYAAKRPNLHDVAKLILLQGMRPEEAMQLRPEEVDPERGTVHIPKGKTKAVRRALKLRAESKEILARRVAAGTEWIFPGKNPDRPIGKLNCPHGPTLEEAGVSFVLYDLRHTFATRAAEASVPLATLAAILGHNNPRSVIKYVHPSEADQFRAIDRLDTVPAVSEPVQPAESRWTN